MDVDELLKTWRNVSDERCCFVASDLRQPTAGLQAGGSTGPKHGPSGTPRVILHVRFEACRHDETVEVPAEESCSYDNKDRIKNNIPS